jgi:hypothetical protein
VVGSYFDPETPVYLIAEEDQVDELVRNLIRIGIDNVKGWFALDVFAGYTELGGTLVSTNAIDFDELQALMANPGNSVLDVRKAVEFRDEGNIEGAQNIAHTRLWDRLDEVPRDKKLLASTRTSRSGRRKPGRRWPARSDRTEFPGPEAGPGAPTRSEVAREPRDRWSRTRVDLLEGPDFVARLPWKSPSDMQVGPRLLPAHGLAALQSRGQLERPGSTNAFEGSAPTPASSTATRRPTW